MTNFTTPLAEKNREEKFHSTLLQGGCSEDLSRYGSFGRYGYPPLNFGTTRKGKEWDGGGGGQLSGDSRESPDSRESEIRSDSGESA